MLKKEALKMFKDLGIDTKKLIEAIKAEEEVDFAMPEINNLTEDQLAERDKNTIIAAKPTIFKEGKEAGIEIANKAVIKKFNLTDVDTKDIDKVTAALEGSVAKGDTGLKEQITLLQKDKLKLEADIEIERNVAKAVTFDNDLIGYFPANRTADLTDKERLLLVKSNLQFKELDGVKVVEKDGVVLRNKTTQEPVPYKDAVATLFTEKKWVSEKGGGGRGGDDNNGGGGGGIKTYSKAIEQFVKDKPEGNPMSPEATRYVSAIAKETTDFNYDA